MLVVGFVDVSVGSGLSFKALLEEYNDVENDMYERWAGQLSTIPSDASFLTV